MVLQFGLKQIFSLPTKVERDGQTDNSVALLDVDVEGIQSLQAVSLSRHVEGVPSWLCLL